MVPLALPPDLPPVILSDGKMDFVKREEEKVVVAVVVVVVVMMARDAETTERREIKGRKESRGGWAIGGVYKDGQASWQSPLA